MPDIQHVVVLMLENRSFDHMLGWLCEHGSDVDGLGGTESCPTDPDQRLGATPRVSVSKAVVPAAYVTDPDVPHEFPDVTYQLFGQQVAPAPPLPTVDGFLASYARQRGSDGVPIGVGRAAQVMACFDPAQVPVISTLAREFAVCDRWFSSVPGPTWPNRFFLAAATSDGHVDSPSGLEAVKDEIGFSTYGMTTLFESVGRSGRDWRIYYHEIAQTLAFSNLHEQLDHFHPFESDFLEDAARGRLPQYAFVEPRYFAFLGKPASDQHPPHDIRHGEQLIATVYDALRSGPAWNQTLLVLLYDEHGGFYDHVPPPTSLNPDGQVSASPAFDFQRLGVRVPAIIVSPWVARGRVDHTLYDHTSVAATVKALFGLPRFLTKRDAVANCFDHLLDLAKPRTDAPQNLSAAAARLLADAPVATTETAGLNDLQRSLVHLGTAVNAPTALRTEAVAAAHVDAMMKQFKAS